MAHQKHIDQESSPWHYRAQTKTGSCFQAKVKGCVAGQCNDVDVIARRDSDSQLTILSGSISGAPVQATQVIAKEATILTGTTLAVGSGPSNATTTRAACRQRTVDA